MRPQLTRGPSVRPQAPFSHSNSLVLQGKGNAPGRGRGRLRGRQGRAGAGLAGSRPSHRTDACALMVRSVLLPSFLLLLP